jgi:hypothetical protein
MALYRGMRPDPADGMPRLENSAGGLGVRQKDGDYGDIPVIDGRVQPGTGGMSAAIDPMSLPGFRRPKALGGTNDKFRVYRIDETQIPVELTIRQDDPIEMPDHRCVEPTLVTTFDEYVLSLQSTRSHWNAI